MPAGTVSTVSMPLASIGMRNCRRSRIWRSDAGALKLITTVRSSGADQSLTIAMVEKTFFPRLGSAPFCSVASTESDLNGAPLWKVTPSRKVRLTEVLSDEIFHSVARLGCGFPSGVYSIRLS